MNLQRRWRRKGCGGCSCETDVSSSEGDWDGTSANTTSIYSGLISMISLTLRAWRPPRNSVWSHVSTMSSATSVPITRAPSASALALLCRRESRAEKASETMAQRTPATLLADIPMPWPVPQMTMARSASPVATFRAAASPKNRVVARFCGMCAYVDDVIPFAAQFLRQMFLELKSCVVASHCDLHISPLS